MSEPETVEALDTAFEVAQAAEITKAMRSRLSIGALGFVVGAAVGGGIAYFILSKRLETKYSQIADEEIEGMRKHYFEKTRALEAEAAKRPLEEIVKEQGYASSNSVSPPMAVPPPKGVAAIEDKDDEDDDDPDPVPEVRNIFREAEVNDTWDWHEERRGRSPDMPYIIHVDERHEMDYESVTVTYYEVDDVLCNERDEVVDPDTRNNLIGAGTLGKFGHGSNDASIVYVRNDALELVFEVVLSPNSYAEEVHGFTHDAFDRGNLERMRARERDEQDE